MIITFCGHSQVIFTDEEKSVLRNILVGEIIKNPISKFYLDGYGDFDGLCLRTLRNQEKSMVKTTDFTIYRYSKSTSSDKKISLLRNSIIDISKPLANI